MQEPPAGPQPQWQPPVSEVPQIPRDPSYPVAAAPNNTLALVSLVSGIASFVVFPVIGAVVAVITGHMARGQIRRTGEAGGLFATIGLVLGYIHLALVILAIVVIVILFLVLGGAFLNSIKT